MSVPSLNIRKVTPILIVDAIEPALELWTGVLAYEKHVEVPHDGRAGFVLLSRDGHEVMMQTKASLRADVPGVAKLGVGSILYMDVDSLDAAISATQGLEVVVPERETAYGAREIFVRDPVGNVLGFAEHKKR
jgi:uncharacterized glyoxalase superfamily protein PhnB